LVGKLFERQSWRQEDIKVTSGERERLCECVKWIELAKDCSAVGCDIRRDCVNVLNG
jgi:hypothetical protein